MPPSARPFRRVRGVLARAGVTLAVLVAAIAVTAPPAAAAQRWSDEGFTLRIENDGLARVTFPPRVASMLQRMSSPELTLTCSVLVTIRSVPFAPDPQAAPLSLSLRRGLAVGYLSTWPSAPFDLCSVAGGGGGRPGPDGPDTVTIFIVHVFDATFTRAGRVHVLDLEAAAHIAVVLSAADPSRRPSRRPPTLQALRRAQPPLRGIRLVRWSPRARPPVGAVAYWSDGRGALRVAAVSRSGRLLHLSLRAGAVTTNLLGDLAPAGLLGFPSRLAT